MENTKIISELRKIWKEINEKQKPIEVMKHIVKLIDQIEKDTDDHEVDEELEDDEDY